MRHGDRHHESRRLSPRSVINPVTQTLYVPYQRRADRIAVLNTATCNAEVTSGCGQTPAVIDVGAGTHELVVSTNTDTVYASNSGYNIFGNTVSVIDGATCDGTDHSGCGHLAAIAKVEEYPYGMALDPATHTLYVANNRNGDSPGTLSVIDTATCKADDTSGCSADFPTVQVGRSPLLVALDTNSHKVFVGDYSSAAVSVVDAATCRAADTSGCRKPAAEEAVGSQPFGLTVDPATDTVYTADLLGVGSLSIFKG